MKTIEHYTDNTAYLKRRYKYENIGTVRGYEIYALTPNEFDLRWRKYYGHIIGTTDICEPITSGYITPEDIIQKIEQLPEEQLAQWLTVDGKLERIRKAIAAQSWTSNGDALFCEICGKSELAEQVRRNRLAYLEREHEKEQRKAEDQARLEEECRAKEAAEYAAKLEQADKDIRDGKLIKAELFEALCAKYGVKLPIKLLGWLREWCVELNFIQYTYRRDKYSNAKHKSTSIGEYMNKLHATMFAA